MTFAVVVVIVVAVFWTAVGSYYEEKYLSPAQRGRVIARRARMHRAALAELEEVTGGAFALGQALGAFPRQDGDSP